MCPAEVSPFPLPVMKVILPVAHASSEPATSSKTAPRFLSLAKVCSSSVKASTAAFREEGGTIRKTSWSHGSHRPTLFPLAGKEASPEKWGVSGRLDRTNGRCNVSVKLGSPKNGKGFHLVSLKGGYTLTKHALIYDHLAINTRTGQANSLVQRATSRSLCQLKFVYTQPTGWNHTSPPYPMLAKRPCRLFAPWKRTEGFLQNPPVSFHC